MEYHRQTIDINDIRALVSKGNTLWTQHIALRIRERCITRVDVITCIQNGEIIEHYPDDFPFPSCLVLGISATGNPLHVVCCINPDENYCIITAYYPNADKWELDFKTRRAGE